MDEDAMSRGLVKALRTRGADVVAASDVGMTHKSDAEHLEYAAEHGLVVYTFNTIDFTTLHTNYLQEGRPHAIIGHLGLERSRHLS